MKIRPKDRTRWQRWFAWHPVIIDNVTVWLEIVERKRDPDIFDWVYSYRTLHRDSRRKIPPRPVGPWSAKASRRSQIVTSSNTADLLTLSPSFHPLLR
jgi:hypothetical protein